MIRPLTIATFLLACGSGLYLYQEKHDAQVLDRTIEKTVRDTGAIREQSRLLAAEWTMLNDPEALRRYADTYLALKPIMPTQFTSLGELDTRLPAPELPAPRTPDQQTDQDEPVADATAPAGPDGAAPAAVAAADAPDGTDAPATVAAEAEDAASMPVPPMPVVPPRRVAMRPVPDQPLSSGQMGQIATSAAGAGRMGSGDGGSEQPYVQPVSAEVGAIGSGQDGVTAPPIQSAIAVRPAERRLPRPLPADPAARAVAANDLRPIELHPDTRSAVRPVALRPTDPRSTDPRAPRPAAYAAVPPPPRPVVLTSAQRPPVQVYRPQPAYRAPAEGAPPAPTPYTGSLLGMAHGAAPAPVPRPTPVNATQWYNTN